MAYVKLNRGYTSYFDPITRVHLTLANPESGVPDHYNLSGLRRAHASGVIVLVESKPEVSQAEEDASGELSADASALQEVQAQSAEAPGTGEPAEDSDEASALEELASEKPSKKRSRRKRS